MAVFEIADPAYYANATSNTTVSLYPQMRWSEYPSEPSVPARPKPTVLDWLREQVDEVVAVGRGQLT